MRTKVKEEIKRIKHFLATEDVEDARELWLLLTSLRACDYTHPRFKNAQLTYNEEKLVTVGAIRHKLFGSKALNRLNIMNGKRNPVMAELAEHDLTMHLVPHFHSHMKMAFKTLGWKWD